MTEIDVLAPSTRWDGFTAVEVSAPNPDWRWWKFWQPRMRTKVFPQPLDDGRVVFEGGPWDGRAVVLSPEVRALAVILNEHNPDARVYYRSSGRVDAAGVPIWTVFG